MKKEQGSLGKRIEGASDKDCSQEDEK